MPDRSKSCAGFDRVLMAVAATFLTVSATSALAQTGPTRNSPAELAIDAAIPRPEPANVPPPTVNDFKPDTAAPVSEAAKVTEKAAETKPSDVVAAPAADASKNDASKNVWLQFTIHHDRLEIHIRDQGIGFDPKHVPDPLESDNLLNVSGRGIFLIRSFMDEFKVESLEGAGTEVTMVKHIHSGVQTKQGGADREHESHNSTN